MPRLDRSPVFVALLLVLPAAARAEPPKLSATAPLGAQRGHATDVVFRGAALADGPRLLAPFAFQLEEPAGGGSGAGRWKVRLTVDARTAVGVYPVRIATEAGLSNPILFAVGQVPQAAEVEPNDTFARAQAIASPVVIEGECAGNDEDFFRFQGRKGDRVVVDALCARVGSGVDPMVRLTTAGWRFVASADDTPGLFTDAYLTAVLPGDGEYVVELCDSRFAGTGRAVYRLLIGAVPYAGEVHPLVLPRGENTAIALRGGTLSGDRLFALHTPSDPRLAMFSPAIPARLLGDPAWANSPLDIELPVPVLLGGTLAVVEPPDRSVKLPPLVPPVTILGRLATEGERDSFTITAPAGSKHEVRVEAWGLGSALDGQLRVIGNGGRVLGETDDGKGGGGRRGGGGGGRAQGPASTDPAFDLTMPDGQSQVTLVIKDLMDRGGVGYTYRVLVTPVETGFQLAYGDAQLAIPRGGAALLPVTVTRAGYKGPIVLEVAGLPAACGVTAVPGTIAAGQATGLVGLKASPDASFAGGEIQVVGRGETGVVVSASASIVFAEQTIVDSGFGMGGTIPSYARPFTSVAATVSRPGQIQVAVERAKVVLPQGSTVDVPLRVARRPGDTTVYTLAAVAPPAGLSVAESALTATAKLTAAPDAPLGETKLGLAVQAPSQGGGSGRRRGGGAATRKDAAAPRVPAVAELLVSVEVVRPARLELADHAIAVTAGGTAAVKGKITRAAPFAGAVEVKIDRLPAGIKAALVKVAAGASEFAVTLDAAANASAAETNANVVPVYKLGGKDVSGESSPLRVKLLPRK